MPLDTPEKVRAHVRKRINDGATAENMRHWCEVWLRAVGVPADQAVAEAVAAQRTAGMATAQRGKGPLPPGYTDEQLAAMMRIPAKKGGAKQAPPPADGPGTEFKKIAAAFGAKMKANCGCRWLMGEMNRLGVAGCRKKFGWVLENLRKNAENFGIGAKAVAVFWAVLPGTAAHAHAKQFADKADPVKSMLLLAIEQAEKKETEKGKDEHG